MSSAPPVAALYDVHGNLPALEAALAAVEGAGAREVIVGTLGTIYGMEGASEDSLGLQHALHQDLTTAGALALLIFFAFAMQCMSTMAVVRRETGGWKWPLIQFSYMSGLAYVCALAVNQIFPLLVR